MRGTQRAVVRNRAIGPNASRAAVEVSSLVVEAGVTVGVPLRNTGRPVARSVTSTAACGPSTRLRSSGRTAAATRAGSGAVCAPGRATTRTVPASGSFSPSGGSTAAGSVAGSTGPHPNQRSPRSNR